MASGGSSISGLGDDANPVTVGDPASPAPAAGPLPRRGLVVPEQQSARPADAEDGRALPAQARRGEGRVIEAGAGGLAPAPRLWTIEWKHLPDVDVAEAGGWRELTTMRRSYQQADPATTLRIVENQPTGHTLDTQPDRSRARPVA